MLNVRPQARLDHLMLPTKPSPNTISHTPRQRTDTSNQPHVHARGARGVAKALAFAPVRAAQPTRWVVLVAKDDRWRFGRERSPRPLRRVQAVVLPTVERGGGHGNDRRPSPQGRWPARGGTDSRRQGAVAGQALARSGATAAQAGSGDRGGGQKSSGLHRQKRGRDCRKTKTFKREKTGSGGEQRRRRRRGHAKHAGMELACRVLMGWDTKPLSPWTRQRLGGVAASCCWADGGEAGILCGCAKAAVRSGREWVVLPRSQDLCGSNKSHETHTSKSRCIQASSHCVHPQKAVVQTWVAQFRESAERPTRGPQGDKDTVWHHRDRPWVCTGASDEHSSLLRASKQ